MFAPAYYCVLQRSVLVAKWSMPGGPRHTSALIRLRHIVKMCSSCAPLCVAIVANSGHYEHKRPREIADMILGKGIRAVPILYCMSLLIACSVIMSLFGFWVGRCARKLPIIDDNLPWTLHRGQVPTATEERAKQDSGPARWPHALPTFLSRQILAFLPDFVRLSDDWSFLEA
jgi:hypothetical protein